MSEPLTVARTARRLGVSRARVLQLDDVLEPRRCECGHRIYDRGLRVRGDTERAPRTRRPR